LIGSSTRYYVRVQVTIGRKCTLAILMYKTDAKDAYRDAKIIYVSGK